MEQGLIKKLAEMSLGCNNITLYDKSIGDNKLVMFHDLSFDQLKFTLVPNSKPFYQDEVVKVDDNHYKAIRTLYEPVTKMVAYKYPYLEKTTPDRMVAETCGIFRTGDYTLIKGRTNKYPNYTEVENIISRTLENFKLKWYGKTSN